MRTPKSLYYRHRFPAIVISYAVRLYFRFQLSLRDAEELLFEREVVVRYETIRRWCIKFGPTFVKCAKQTRPRPGLTWYLDEMFVSLRGEKHLLWRVVDEHSTGLDILLQKRRNKAAAKRFFGRLLGQYQYGPDKIVTDKLRSYAAAKAEIPALHDVRHVFLRAKARVNNRAENSHQPTRERERRMKGFRCPTLTQAFLSSFGPICQHFAIKRHRLGAARYRVQLAKWAYLYRAVDREGKTVDFRLSARRDIAAAKAFFRKAIGRQPHPPQSITLDGYAASHRAVRELKANCWLPEATRLRSSKFLTDVFDKQFFKRLNALV